METIMAILVPLVLLAVMLRVILLPMKLIWKLGINSACGFLCLWMVNALSAFTGLLLPINPVTVAIAGFFGLPGMAVLALLQLLF